MMRDTKVKCDVYNCKHNNCDYCNLDVLDISSICNGRDCSNKRDTVCKSFSKKS